ncbi:F0F1 ATP synthase subunit B family protein [Yunchengibacter salinarum]|uniref:F0F1 ATP synthase subunit B family protein n=1 Tax=Yunchengibacter salinarum TaxID=3133399 RepID=UPI0035B5A3AD
MAVSGEPVYLDPTFWVAGSFVVFVGVLAYAGVHRKVAAMLDARSAEIGRQIDEARRLREDSEKLLADYQRQQREAEKDAEAMLAQARDDAEAVRAEARQAADAMVARRTAMAEQKIEQAEARAVKAVRASAVTVAVEAARSVLAEQMKGDAGARDVEAAIGQTEKALH